MFDWLIRKKSVTRPHSIRISQYIADGWQSNVDNNVCDVFVWDKNYGWLKIADISTKHHPFIREAYSLSFSNLDFPLLFFPAIHNARLQIIYHDQSKSR